MLRSRETQCKLEAAGNETAAQDTVKVKPLKAGKAPMGAIYTKSKHSIDATHNPHQPVADRQAEKDKQCCSQRLGTQALNSECYNV